MSIADENITEILNDLGVEHDEKIDRVFSIFYEEFRRRARKLVAGERKEHTLRATEIANELWIELRESKGLKINDRKHFFRLGAKIMKDFLINHARRRKAEKRDGDRQRVPLDDTLGLEAKEKDWDVLDLYEALEELAVEHPRQADVVELKFAYGSSIQELASILEVSESAVKRDWDFAKAWLFRRLKSA